LKFIINQGWGKDLKGKKIFYESIYKYELSKEYDYGHPLYYYFESSMHLDPAENVFPRIFGILGWNGLLALDTRLASRVRLGCSVGGLPRLIKEATRLGFTVRNNGNQDTLLTMHL